MVDGRTSPAAPPRYVIVGGGTPSPEHLAALAVALTPVAVPAREGPRGPTGWALASLLEGVGRRRFVSADDLAAHADL